MTFDLVLRNAGSPAPRIVPSISAFAAVVSLRSRPGFPKPTDRHRIWPAASSRRDWSKRTFISTSLCLLGRCNCEQGTLDEAIAEVASAKKTFTEEDVYARARNTLEKSLKHGTTRMRTHVEVDPRVGLTSFARCSS